MNMGAVENQILLHSAKRLHSLANLGLPSSVNRLRAFVVKEINIV